MRKKLWNNKHISPNATVNGALDVSCDWLRAKQLLPCAGGIPTYCVAKCDKWHLPPTPFFKFNFDAVDLIRSSAID